MMVDKSDNHCDDGLTTVVSKTTTCHDGGGRGVREEDKGLMGG